MCDAGIPCFIRVLTELGKEIYQNGRILSADGRACGAPGSARKRNGRPARTGTGKQAAGRVSGGLRKGCEKMYENREQENLRCRRLNEYYPRGSEELYLIACGTEQGLPDGSWEEPGAEGYQLCVILSGQGEMENGAEEIALSAGSIVLIRPEERVSFRIGREAPWTCCRVAFDGSRAGEILRSAGFDDGTDFRECCVETGQFFQICDRILSEPELSLQSALMRQGCLLEFLSLAVESYARESTRAIRRARQGIYQKEDYVRRALDYMESNYAGVTVAGVARYLNIDRSYFSSVFRHGTGISPSEYLLQLRMRESCRRISDPSVKIQEIAHCVGYDDALTFSKAFKRYFGVSPKAFRNLPPAEREELARTLEERLAVSAD